MRSFSLSEKKSYIEQIQSTAEHVHLKLINVFCQKYNKNVWQLNFNEHNKQTFLKKSPMFPCLLSNHPEIKKHN